MLGLIDRLNQYIAKGVSWLVPVLILELAYDTLARYLFNAPSAWSYDISYMLYGTIFMLMAPHTLKLDRHVRIEVFYARLSVRSRAVLDCLCYLIFYFPVAGALGYYGWIFTAKSWAIRETSGLSMWQPPIYPFKAILPLAAFLLVLQGLVQFMTRLKTCISGKDD
jgi:TRAP-type mannitol/chloroaromatic compound transport system permease small subunit